MKRTPTLRVAFIDEFCEFNSPVDMYCPDCGKRTHNGVLQWKDYTPLYYAKCYYCGCWVMEDAGDYEEHFRHYFPESYQSLGETANDN